MMPPCLMRKMTKPCYKCVIQMVNMFSAGPLVYRINTNYCEIDIKFNPYEI